MPDFRNTVGSGTIILYPSTLLNICINCNSLSVNFSFHFGFYMYTDMPSVNTIVWCLPFQFLYFSPFSLPHGTGWDLQCNATMVMVGVSIFISFLLRGRLFNILPLSLLFSVGFLNIPLGRWRKFPSVLSLLKFKLWIGIEFYQLLFLHLSQ